MTIIGILLYLAVAAVIQVWVGRHWVYDEFRRYGWDDNDRGFAFVWSGLVAIFWPISIFFVLISIARRHGRRNPLRWIPNTWSRVFVEPKAKP